MAVRFFLQQKCHHHQSELTPWIRSTKNPLPQTLNNSSFEVSWNCSFVSWKPTKNNQMYQRFTVTIRKILITQASPQKAYQLTLSQISPLNHMKLFSFLICLNPCWNKSGRRWFFTTSLVCFWHFIYKGHNFLKSMSQACRSPRLIP